MPEPVQRTFSVPGQLPESKWGQRQPGSRWFRVIIFTTFFGLIAALVVLFLFVPRIWRLDGPKAAASLDYRNANDLSKVLRSNAASPDRSRKFNQPKFADAKGRLFWQEALRAGLLKDEHLEVLTKLVSLNSKTDVRGEAADSIQSSSWQLPSESCSYTGPRMADFLRVLKEPRLVLVTFNARNWNNYPMHGVLVIWSDRVEPEWLSFGQANADWGITAEEWADPAGKLFGKKAPFQHTYE